MMNGGSGKNRFPNGKVGIKHGPVEQKKEIEKFLMRKKVAPIFLHLFFFFLSFFLSVFLTFFEM